MRLQDAADCSAGVHTAFVYVHCVCGHFEDVSRQNCVPPEQLQRRGGRIPITTPPVKPRYLEINLHLGLAAREKDSGDVSHRVVSAEDFLPLLSHKHVSTMKMSDRSVSRLAATSEAVPTRVSSQMIVAFSFSN